MLTIASQTRKDVNRSFKLTACQKLSLKTNNCNMKTKDQKLNLERLTIVGQKQKAKN